LRRISACGICPQAISSSALSAASAIPDPVARELFACHKNRLQNNRSLFNIQAMDARRGKN
jgi:hypothetical protein